MIDDGGSVSTAEPGVHGIALFAPNVVHCRCGWRVRVSEARGRTQRSDRLLDAYNDHCRERPQG